MSEENQNQQNAGPHFSMQKIYRSKAQYIRGFLSIDKIPFSI